MDHTWKSALYPNTRIVPAGVEWDAIKVPRFYGLLTLGALTGSPGAVLCEPTDRVLYFLVPPGSTTGWKLPESTPLGESCYVILPPHKKETPPGPYWLVSPINGTLHTATQILHAALESVLASCPDPGKPDLERITFDQAKGWACALCGKRLYSARSLGKYCTGKPLLTTSTELFACVEVCQ